MIIEVSGDILLSEAEAIAHGVAPNDDFKKGLALSLRENWPAMYKDFRHYCQSTHPKEGEVWTWQGVGGKKIFNLFTQQGSYDQGSHPGKASEDFVNKSLKNLKEHVQEMNIKSLAITKVATGVGGLDYKVVKPLIQKHLGDLKIPVYVYAEFHKGMKAKEH